MKPKPLGICQDCWDATLHSVRKHMAWCSHNQCIAVWKADRGFGFWYNCEPLTAKRARAFIKKTTKVNDKMLDFLNIVDGS